MKFIGIDYGTKKIGLAVSNEDGTVAFPYSVMANDKNFLKNLEEILKKEKISKIVIGESKDFQMKDNPIMNEVRAMDQELEEKGYEVIWEPEFMTTKQALRIPGNDKMIRDHSRHKIEVIKQADAHAAAIILQSYIDKEKIKN